MVSLKRCIVALSVVYLTLSAIALHVNAAEAEAPSATEAAAPVSDAAAPAAEADASASAAGGNIYCASANDKILCEKVTKTATNWKEAIAGGLKEALRRTESVIRKSKAESLGDSGCDETYLNIRARVKECMDLVNSGDPEDDINFKLSASLTSLEDCENALKLMKKEQTPFFKDNRKFNHILEVCLTIDKTKNVK